MKEGSGGRATLLDGIADPVKLGVVRMLSEVEEATTAELGAGCQTTVPTVRRHLEAMVLWGIVAEAAGPSDGLSRGRPAARFTLAPELRRTIRALLSLEAGPDRPPSSAR